MDINANKEKKTEKNEIGKYFKYQKVSEIFGEQYLIANYENKRRKYIITDIGYKVIELMQKNR